jgi:hypothetical protein
VHKNITAALAYFALVFGAGFLLGSIRVPYLVPRFGERMAELLEMPIMLAITFLAAKYVVRRYQVSRDMTSRMAVGLLALSLLVAAELTLVVSLQGQSIPAYVASRDPVSGSVYVAMLALFGLMPWIVARAVPQADRVQR